MNNPERPPNRDDENQGLFKKYPKLSIILIGLLSYGLLLGMCAFIGVLMLRG